jgi:hypothetical protein
LHEINSSEHANSKIKTIIKNFYETSNIVIFVRKTERIYDLKNFLKDLCLRNGLRLEIDSVEAQTNYLEIEKINQKWKRIDSHLVLIIENDAVENVEIDNAKCVIHYDIPKTMNQFAQRLWFMSKNFNYYNNEQQQKGPLYQNDIESELNLSYAHSEPSSSSFNQQTKIFPKSSTNLSSFLGNLGSIDLDKPLGARFVNNNYGGGDQPNIRLCSYIFLKRSQREKAEEFPCDLYDYLIRIGLDKKYMPKIFFEFVEKSRQRKEEAKKRIAICPYLKSFGKCMDLNPESCLFRHNFYPEIDHLKQLNDGFKIPNEGYIRVILF